jgi:predicted HAD superfamily hydrolase
MLTSLQLSDKVRKMAVEGRLPQVVCFDYFDTLITRTVFPEATKQLTAKRIGGLVGNSLEWGTVYELRAGLEKQLCRENADSGYDLEFSLDEIAARLFESLEKIHDFPRWVTETHFAKIFVNIELQTEILVQKPCPVMFDLLHFLHDNGIRLCLISDFYLPKLQFKKLLDHHSIGALFENIFISADFKLSKGGSGRLYREVASMMQCETGDMLMIGDNIHADCNMAKRVGLQTLHLDRTEQHAKYNELKQLSQRSIPGQITLEEKFKKIFEKNRSPFFAEMGLSLWLFTHRLFLQLIKDGVSELFFCSKEGEFLKKIFVQYQKQCFGEQIIQSHYLLVSRKATFICSLDSIESEDFSRLFCNYSDISFKEFLLSLNFSEETAQNICKVHSLEYEKKIQNLKNKRKFEGLIASHVFREQYETHRLEQKKNFQRYIQGFGAPIEKNGIALVDVGWKGSIQNNIYKSFDGKIAARGYFIGSLSPTDVSENNKKNGILFCDVPEHSPFIHAYNNNRSLFEMLLGATHGSADGYFTKDAFKTQKAARKSIEKPGCTIDDDLVVTVLDLPEERELYNQKIKPLQDSFMAMNYELTKEYCLNIENCPGLEWFARQHARMVFKPRKSEIEFFSRLYHLENFGLFEFTDFQAERNIPLRRKFKNLKMLLQNRGGVLETGVWPPVIFRRLGLEFLQPIDARRRYNRVFCEEKNGK